MSDDDGMRVRQAAPPPGTAVQTIMDHVREGRITPAQGADLLALREELRRAGRPWWVRALDFLWRMVR